MIGFLLPPALPTTTAALRDADTGSPESQWVAAVSLGQENGSHVHEAIEALTRLARSDHEEIRAQALEGLCEQVRHNAQLDLNIFIDALSDPAPAVRCVAVDALLMMPVEHIDDHLLPLLSDPDPSVRAASAAACSEIPLDSAVPQLVSLLDDPTPFVRLQGAIALAYLGRHDGIDILIDALYTHLQDALEAIRALGFLGNAHAAAALARIAEKRFGDSTLKANAAVALFRCAGTNRALIIVTKMLASRNTDTKLSTLSAIATLPIAGISQAVGKLLLDRDILVASTAIETLRKLAGVDSEALNTLRNIANTISPQLKNELRECIEFVQGNIS